MATISGSLSGSYSPIAAIRMGYSPKTAAWAGRRPRSNRGRLNGRHDRPLGGERVVNFIDRAAGRLEADEQNRHKRQEIPGGE
jgi:hypothetical protein